MGACQAPPSLGFSRKEHWCGLPFPSPMHKGEKWKWSRSVPSDSQRPHGLQPIRLLHPWDFPGKSTGVGHQCLLCQMVTTTVYNTSAVSQKDKPTVFSQSPNSPPTSIPKSLWILFNGWVIFHGVYVPQLPYPFICWWATRLFPCPGYDKQCCDEHWGACVSFRSGFMEYYSAIKKNSFEWILMRWMKLEPIKQSEVSQKDKDHYNILTHIYGI